jgi:tRNA pseudouridine65 synthase
VNGDAPTDLFKNALPEIEDFQDEEHGTGVPEGDIAETSPLRVLEPQIIYQGQGFAVISKPSGLVAHRGPYFRRGPTLHDWAKKTFRTNQIDLVHRIDSGTSGIIVIGLDKDVTGKIATQFKAGTVQKTYQAIVRGWVEGAGSIDWPLLRKDKAGYHNAETRYQALAQVEIPAPVGRYQTARYSLVEFYPLTGRTHQIRKHACHIKHPIAGDVNYGDGAHNRFFRDTVKVHRLLLHAAAIQFLNPETNQPFLIRDPWPESVRTALSAWNWTWLPREQAPLEDALFSRPFEIPIGER